MMRRSKGDGQEQEGTLRSIPLPKAPGREGIPSKDVKLWKVCYGVGEGVVGQGTGRHRDGKDTRQDWTELKS